jgi:surface polysaccharide O-acyltransferase-like enzyme
MNAYNVNHDSRESSKNKRIFSLDLLKAMSIMAVISYHAVFIPRTLYESSVMPLEILFSPLRFCVPTLFTISFILLGRELEKNPKWSPWKVLRNRYYRLIMPTIFWFSLAFVLHVIISRSSFSCLITRLSRGTIFQGSYFLIALLEMTLIFILLNKRIFDLKFLVMSILGQIFLFEFIQALLEFDHHSELIQALRLADRPLFIYWFCYMFIGAFLWKHWSKITSFSNSISIKIKTAVILLGSIAIGFEQYHFIKISYGNIPPFDYAMISCILSVFILFICFASVQDDYFPNFMKMLILLFSKYSLGIFCISGILSEIGLSVGTHLFKGYIFDLPEVLMIKFMGWIVLLFSSLVVSMILDRTDLRVVVR